MSSANGNPDANRVDRIRRDDIVERRGYQGFFEVRGIITSSPGEPEQALLTDMRGQLLREPDGSAVRVDLWELTKDDFRSSINAACRKARPSGELQRGQSGMGRHERIPLDGPLGICPP